MNAVRIRWSRRIALALAYLLFLVCLAEFGARAFFWLAGSRTWEPENDVYFRDHWMETRAGQDSLGMSFDVYHPVRAWATRPGIRDLEVFGGKVLNSNSDGLRGRREYDPKPPPGVLRVVLLGDSFTFGEGVSDHETYAHGVERRLPRVEMVNLGVHGYGHDQMLLFFRELGAKYHPDLVMLGFLGADMKRNRLSFRGYAKPFFERSDSGGESDLVLRGVPVPEQNELEARLRFRSRLPDLVEILRIKWQRRTGALWEQEMTITAAILDELLREIEAIGAQPVFVYLPVGHETYQPSESKREEFFFDYAASREVLHWSLRSDFLDAAAHGVDVGRVFHWNAEGHAVAAAALARRLEEDFGDRLAQ